MRGRIRTSPTAGADDSARGQALSFPPCGAAGAVVVVELSGGRLAPLSELPVERGRFSRGRSASAISTSAGAAGYERFGPQSLSGLCAGAPCMRAWRSRFRDCGCSCTGSPGTAVSESVGPVFRFGLRGHGPSPTSSRFCPHRFWLVCSAGCGTSISAHRAGTEFCISVSTAHGQDRSLRLSSDDGNRAVRCRRPMSMTNLMQRSTCAEVDRSTHEWNFTHAV